MTYEVSPPPPVSSPSQREGEDLGRIPSISSPSQREGEDTGGGGAKQSDFECYSFVNLYIFISGFLYTNLKNLTFLSNK